MRSYLDLISAGRRRQIEQECGKMEETLRDRIFHILKMTKDDPLLASDRVIAAMFEHLENVTPEMRKAGAGQWMASDPEEVALITFRKMLAAARKEAEK